MSIDNAILAGVGMCAFSYVLIGIVRIIADHDTKCNGCECNKEHPKTKDQNNNNEPKAEC